MYLCLLYQGQRNVQLQIFNRENGDSLHNRKTKKASKRKTTSKRNYKQKKEAV